MGGNIQSPDSLPARSVIVNAPSVTCRPIFMILDRSAAVLAADSSSTLEMGMALSRAGRKKGAFSGSLGASLGLLRSLIWSRWRSVIQLLFGTRLSDMMSSLSWSSDGTGAESSVSEDSSSNAPERRPCPFSPDTVGPDMDAISLSEMWREGTCLKRVMLFQMLTPTGPSHVVARNSPVAENERAVH